MNPHLLNPHLLERNTGVTALALMTILSKVNIIAHVACATFGCKLDFASRAFMTGIALQFGMRTG